ncbi:MAG TPA: winged helix-turn-helix domain-containing protein [Pyrinomonadaceae bacterium]
MAETKYRYFEFGEYLLDTHCRVLQKNGEPVHLTPRTFDLLCVLVENAGRVLEHDELLEKVWEGTFVEQANLKKTISALRQALGEPADASEFITTVPRKGYRFTAPVRAVPDETVLIRETKAEIIFEEEIDDQTGAEKIAPLLPESKKASLSRPSALLLLVTLVIVTPALTVISFRYFSGAPRNNFSVEKVRQKKILLGDSVSGATLSRNGNFFVFNAVEGGKNTLRVKNTATESEIELIPPMNASFWFPTFSPDGNYVYFYFSNREEPTKSGVYRIPTLGGARQLISEKKFHGMRFSPDGKKLAVFLTYPEGDDERQELLTINPDGTGERKIAVLPLHSLVRGIAWSPDGLSLLCGIRKHSPLGKNIYYAAEFSLADGTEKVIIPEQEEPFTVEDVLPDKSSLLLRQRETNAEIFQVWQYFLASGEKIRVTNDDSTYSDIVVTADGKTIGAMRGLGLTSIWTVDVAGQNEQRQVAANAGSVYSLSWTADDRLVFSTMENAREYVGIINADGTNKRLLTDGGDGIRPLPEVSADGRAVVFMSERSGGRQVWQIDLEGRNLKKLTAAIGIGEAKLLADGQTLILNVYLKPGVWALMKHTPDGQIKDLNMTDTDDWDISPDEKQMALYNPVSRVLYVKNMESGEITSSFNVKNLGSLHWTPDGKALSYVRSENDFQEIVLQPLDGSPEKILTTVRGEGILNFGWSRNGSRIALVRTKAHCEAILIQAQIGN